MSKNSGFQIFCWNISSRFTPILLYMIIAATSKDVYNMGLQGPILGAILGPQISQSSFLWGLSQKVFTGFTSALLHVLIASTFRDVCYMGLRGTILGPFWVPKLVKLPVFGQFICNFSLVSHQYCSTCSLQLPLDVWRIWASEAQFIGHFGPKNRSIFQFLVIF